MATEVQDTAATNEKMDVQQEEKAPASDESKKTEDLKSAVNLLAQGKRNIICGEVPVAVNQFQEACSLLAKHHGETAQECAEAYFCYGQSLLDLARMETGVLGNALQGVDVEEENEEKENDTTSEQFEKPDLAVDEREKLRLEVYDAMSEKPKEGKEKEGNEETTNEKAEKTDKENTEKESEKGEESSASKEKADTNGNAEGEAAEEAEEDDEEEEEGGTEEEACEDGGEGTSDAKDEEDADDVSNLQLAWEMLELSKIIYLKTTDKEAQLKAAQAYLKLGEVSLETEQYDKATDDFMACLEIQKSQLEPTDRLLAETHYQLGLSNGFDKKYNASIEHYQAAIKVIEEKVALLEKVIEENSSGKGKEPSNPDDPVTQATQEIKELKEILPDIASKIEDAEEEKKNLEQLKKEIIGGAVSAMSSSESLSSQQQTTEVKKAADISHLIRKKRKPDDEIDDQDTKKSRQEDGSGDATTKATQNGHEKATEEEKSAETAEPMTT